MQVIITPEAQKQYKKLPRQAQARIKRKLLLLEEDSLLGKKLEGELSGFRSVKVWPYKIIYMIEIPQKKIYIASIAHRQGVYR